MLDYYWVPGGRTAPPSNQGKALRVCQLESANIATY